MQNDNDIIKTYVVKTGHNGSNTKTSTTFHVGFPEKFRSSTNRRFITVMPPKLIYGDKDRTMTPNEYIMHCSFIYRDPYHEKSCMATNMKRRSKYKKYEYKANYDGFDVTFTHSMIHPVNCWRIQDDSYENILRRIEAKLSEDIFNDDYWDVLNKITSHVTDWKNNHGIDVGTLITPETIAIVPLFNGFGQGGKLSTLIYPTFPEPTRYSMIDIMAHAYTIEYYAYMKRYPELTFVKQHDPNSGTYKDNFYEWVQVQYTEDVLGTVWHMTGRRYKILEDTEPWSYYAEFLLQY